MEKEKIIRQIVAGIEKGRLPETKKTLMLQDFCGDSVAHILASRSDKTGWATEDKEILMLQDKTGVSVAYELAYSHPTWTTGDTELLLLVNKWGNTVEDALIARGNKRRKNQTGGKNEKV